MTGTTFSRQTVAVPMQTVLARDAATSTKKTPTTFQNIGALTTTFSAPSSCTDLAMTHIGVNWNNLKLGGQCNNGRVSKADPSCFPSVYGHAMNEWNRENTFDDQPNTIDPIPVFSPGLVCPVGYVSACSRTRDNKEYDVANIGTVLKGAQTAIACCPTGYTCSEIGQCYSAVQSNQKFRFLTYSNGQCSAATSTTSGMVITAKASAIVLVRGDPNATGISPAEKVVTGIAAALAILLCVFLGFLCLKRRRRQGVFLPGNGISSPKPIRNLVGYSEFDLSEKDIRAEKRRSVANGMSPGWADADDGDLSTGKYNGTGKALCRACDEAGIDHYTSHVGIIPMSMEDDHRPEGHHAEDDHPGVWTDIELKDDDSDDDEGVSPTGTASSSNNVSPRGSRFGSGGFRFSPGGSRFGSGGFRFSPGGSRTSPNGSRYSPGGSLITPDESRIIREILYESSESN